MNKRLLLLFLGFLTLLVVSGNTVRFLRVSHHGTMVAIPLKNVDSISFSKLSADGLTDTAFVTALFSALDSVHAIPLSSIDSMSIVEVESRNVSYQIGTLRQYALTQQGQDVGVFQDSLFQWLQRQDWVAGVRMNAERDAMVVTFDTGVKYTIAFVNEDSEDGQDASAAALRPFGEPAVTGIEMYDVSEEEDEEIISGKRALYVEGCTMWQWDYDAYIEKLRQTVKDSPVDLVWTEKTKDISFLQEDYSDCGLLIITETHGAIDAQGAFQVQASSSDPYLLQKFTYKENGKEKTDYSILYQGMTITVVKGKVLWVGNVYWVEPCHVAKALDGNRPIVFANYCWSYGLTKVPRLNDCLLFGYVTQSGHSQNQERLQKFTELILNGSTFAQAIAEVKKPYVFNTILGQLTCLPKSNKSDSLRRYFSIGTSEVTEFSQGGCPIIRGRVNGYGNLKKKKVQVEFVLYVHEGDAPFIPSDDGVKTYTYAVLIDKEGNLSCNYGSLLEPDMPYSFRFGMEFDGKIYYGPMVTYRNALCPDGQHPHLIDLGLPSGTRWACCNVAASGPEQCGGYYAWGDALETPPYTWSSYAYADKESTDYSCLNIGENISGTQYDVASLTYHGEQRMPSAEDAEELIDHTNRVWTTFKGVDGCLVTGSSGHRIFFPSTGWKTAGETRDFGKDVNLWLSTAPKNRWNDKADALKMREWYTAVVGSQSKYVGYPVRGVSK